MLLLANYLVDDCLCPEFRITQASLLRRMFPMVEANLAEMAHLKMSMKMNTEMGLKEGSVKGIGIVSIGMSRGQRDSCKGFDRMNRFSPFLQLPGESHLAE